MIENEILWDYLFSFNPYQQMWCAFKRKDATEYFNGTLSQEEVLKNKDINVLIEYLCKESSLNIE